MNIEWVNHASFIVDTKSLPTRTRDAAPKQCDQGVRLICDPWIDGSAFNNGWRQLAASRLSYDAFASITHIWFSHEHPDHFSPPNLQKIAPEIRARITVLFQQTTDQRVIALCRRLGFQTQELPDDTWVEVGELKLICGHAGRVDSWLGIDHHGRKLLNMNDCVFDRVEELTRIRALLGGAPEVLFTQFSYANWCGNKNDPDALRRAAARKRDEMRRQVQVFEPARIVPFASYVWFSHEDNFYMNQGVNRIPDIFRYCTEDLHVPPVVMYPGDVWRVGDAFDSAPSLRLYEADFEAIFAAPRLDVSAPVSDEALNKVASDFAERLRLQNSRWMMACMPPATVYLPDKNQTARLTCRSMKLMAGRIGRIDIEMGSDSLAYCMNFGWGGDTLQVNGRYQVPVGGSARRFFRIFRIPALNITNERFDARFLMRKIAAASGRFRSA